MARTFTVVLLLALAGCSDLPGVVVDRDSACAAGEATYACQVQRYQDINGD